jgi:hypothetical protein
MNEGCNYTENVDKVNTPPRWIVSLERNFDKLDGRKQREGSKKELCDHIEVNIGTDEKPWCYPRYLGITRRSCLEAHMVLDMEYREQERPEHGPGGPIFFFSASFVLSAVPASITTGLGLHQKRLLLHEVIGPRYHGMCHI